MINVSVGLFCFSGRSVIRVCTAVAAKSCQSCQSYPTLCDPVDDSLPGSCLWDSPGKNTGVGYCFPLQCMKVKSESEVAESCPTSPSMGLPRPEYWSGLPLPSPRICTKLL